jgi:hypothetical protein
MIALGGRFVVTMDGRSVVDERDSTFLKGRIGLWASGDGTSFFDDLRVKKLR